MSRFILACLGTAFLPGLAEPATLRIIAPANGATLAHLSDVRVETSPEIAGVSLCFCSGPTPFSIQLTRRRSDDIVWNLGPALVWVHPGTHTLTAHGYTRDAGLVTSESIRVTIAVQAPPHPSPVTGPLDPASPPARPPQILLIGGPNTVALVTVRPVVDSEIAIITGTGSVCSDDRQWAGKNVRLRAGESLDLRVPVPAFRQGCLVVNGVIEVTKLSTEPARKAGN